MGAVLHTFEGWDVRNPLAFGMMAAAYALALWLVWRFVGVAKKELAARGA
jgi:DHA2 family methylenomycin A resistance protein-like MFS transporter